MISLSFRGPRKRTSAKISVVILTTFILTVILLLSTGCSSFPRKRPNTGSMLVFVQDIDNPKAVQVQQELYIRIESHENANLPLIPLTPGTWQAHYLPVPAGSYTLIDPAGGPDYRIDLGDDTIRLIQAKAVYDPDPGGIILGPLEPSDRKRVSEDMSDYINFSEWIGSFYEGFGPYTPQFALQEARYEYTVTTDPEGGSVIIDGENWGESPITVQLEPGKHLVRIEKEGYVSIQTFITVESAGEITFELEPEAKKELTQEEGIAKQYYTVLISPLRNIGDPEDDYLKTVFSDGIASGLYGREDIRVLMHPEDLPLSENLLSPDFSYAEEKGAELLVSGRFLAKGEQLFVHATLYDVLTQQVKTSTMYTGEAGLGMFDSIDTMTEEFVANMDRVLPKIGEDVVEQKQTVTREIVTYEKKITDEEIVDERNKRRHSLALYYTWGGTLDPGPL
ncbi:MAG: PEGA domain-containing protein, partial [Spirochaetia bacterium]